MDAFVVLDRGSWGMYEEDDRIDEDVGNLLLVMNTDKSYDVYEADGTYVFSSTYVMDSGLVTLLDSDGGEGISLSLFQEKLMDDDGDFLIPYDPEFEEALTPTSDTTEADQTEELPTDRENLAAAESQPTDGAAAAAKEAPAKRGTPAAGSHAAAAAATAAAGSDPGDYGIPYYWYDADGDIWYWDGTQDVFIGYGGDYYIDGDQYYENNDAGWEEDYDIYSDPGDGDDAWSDPGDTWDYYEDDGEYYEPNDAWSDPGDTWDYYEDDGEYYEANDDGW